PGFPFVARPHTHESVDFVRYLHYMYLITQHEEYGREAKRLTAVVLSNFRVADTDYGPALVAPRSLLTEGGSEDFLLPSAYVRYVHASAVDLFFEREGAWEDPELMEMLARSLAHF